MTKKEVMDLLTKNLKDAVPDFADGEIDTRKIYKDMGIDSLDLVEVVSKTMHEMGVKLAPNALAGVKTLDDLVNLLVQAKGA